MYIENTIVVRGDWPRIWRLSSEIEKWPERLPHYRKVKLLAVSANGLEKNAYMSAWRDFLPVSWESIQRLQPNDDPTQAHIIYNHVKGVTRGMRVEWIFKPLGGDDYRVTITHNWTPTWPVVGPLAARLISQQIVHKVADKTLARVRQLAVQSEAAAVAS